jgi:hypothetical protein
VSTYPKCRGKYCIDEEAGLGAGATEAILVVSPMEVIKIRLQAQQRMSLFSSSKLSRTSADLGRLFSGST